MIHHSPDSRDFDLIVIGAGPAGYVGAVRAAQLGLSVACVEAASLGGVCLNWGCIPTKALLAQADTMTDFLAGPLGRALAIEPTQTDWPALIAHKNQVVQRLNKAVAHLFQQHGVTHIPGRATITASGQSTGPQHRPCIVEVRDDRNRPIARLKARHVLAATGARPRPLPAAPVDGRRILNAAHALDLPAPPHSLLVIGAGAIGVEFASLLAAFGTRVTIVEMLDRLLPGEDADLSAALARAFRRRNIQYLTSHRLADLHPRGDFLQATVEPLAGGKPKSLSVQYVLVAVGLIGNSDRLFDPSLAVERDEHQCLLTDRHGSNPTYQTTVPGVHAVGDLAGPPFLAHLASAEAMVCVERLAGRKPIGIDYTAIPACTYCQPQVASVGATEQHLVERGGQAGRDFLVGRYPFTGHGMAVATAHNQGLVKLIADARTHILLGAHLAGHHVTEVIAEPALAMRLGATLEDLATTVHPHPTMNEAVREAALLALAQQQLPEP